MSNKPKAWIKPIGNKKPKEIKNVNLFKKISYGLGLSLGILLLIFLWLIIK